MSQKTIKLILLGDGKVGKTSLYEKYFNDKFPSSYSSTKSVQGKKLNININGEIINLHLIDTPGNEQWHKENNSNCYPNTNSIIILFDLTNKVSFDNVFAKWIPYFFSVLRINSTDNFPVIILGNFSDLGNKRQIQKPEIQKKIKEIIKYTSYYYYQEISIKKEKIQNFINKIILFISARPLPEPGKSKIEGDGVQINELKNRIKILEEEKVKNEENHKIDIKALQEKLQMLEQVKMILTDKGKKDKEEKDKLNETIKKLNEEIKKKQEKTSGENNDGTLKLI